MPDEIGFVQHIEHAQTSPRRFVHIGRADPSTSGPDGGFAELALRCAIERDVIGQDQVCLPIDPQSIRGYVDPLSGQLVQFLEQAARIDDHTGAQHTRNPRVQDTRWSQVELERLSTRHNRVSGVVAAAESGHNVRFTGQHVGDFAFSFVAPLGP